MWVDFADPDTDAQRFHCDMTWLTSSWRCIFGDGCPGIYADRPDDGCCTLGAHFTDDEDVARVAAAVEELDDATWQYRGAIAGGPSVSAWTELDSDGVRKTRVVDGACVLLNRPGFPGGPGCALHAHAIASGEEPHRVKPDVCWQLPIRRSYRTVDLPDDTSYLEVTITEYDRRSWGPGGHDLDWYCSGSPAAHTAREPLYRSCRAELTALMGEAAYDELVVRCEAYLRVVRAPHVTGRALLPLHVHPATVEAEGHGAAGSGPTASP